MRGHKSSQRQSESVTNPTASPRFITTAVFHSKAHRDVPRDWHVAFERGPSINTLHVYRITTAAQRHRHATSGRSTDQPYKGNLICARYTWGPLRETSFEATCLELRRRRARRSSRWHDGSASSRAGGETAGVLAGAYLKENEGCLLRMRTTSALLPISSTTSSGQIVDGADDDERGVRSWHVGCPSGRADDIHVGVLT